ncbi:MAG TPA: FAD-dependent oxidoreductase [Saprospiraceae bacterium]|nr:FAD-dependent oxidoreductase [Saprospiraceae bacterium]HMP13286.1 FAD-dependent oxidoreductase [Saprospiraceae bacterium]
MPWKWYDSKVTKIAQESPTTKRFWLETPEQLDFRAGQFVTMDLPISDKRLKRWRSYSIANAPNNERELEFCILQMEGGAATAYLFDEVKEGTNIKFKGPDGTFTLPDTVEKDLVFICTGTGVAPFRSMIWDLYNHNKLYKNIHLIFGTRYADGILYRQEFEEFQQKMPRFRYSVALSREENLRPSDFSFEIVKGYIHQLYLAHYNNTRPDVDFYICGWSNMIDDAVANLLLKLQYDKSQIHYELYG